MFSYKKNWKQKFEHQRNYTKRDNVATEKIVKSIGDKKSSWIMNLEENFSKNHESLRQKRQESWISRFKWFRFIPRYYRVLTSSPVMLRKPHTNPFNFFLGSIQKKFRRVCMEFSKHNRATISETICPEMLIFGK